MKIEGGQFLVTGGAGFIGSHLIDRLLARGAREVIIFDNFIRGTRANVEAAVATGRATIFGLGGDTRNTDEVMEAAAGADGVFHLACLSLLHSDRYPRAAVATNIDGGFNVFDACIKQGVKRLVHASSSSVYGDAVYSPMDEHHPLNNKNFYGATKIALESLLVALHDKYKLDYLAMRYMNVYGPRQDFHGAYVGPIISAIDRMVRGERPIVYGDGSQAYDFVAVDDAVTATVAAMEVDATNLCVNVGTGIKTSVLTVIQRIMQLMDYQGEIDFRPGGPTFVVDRVGGTQRAKEVLGFTAGLCLDDGLRRVIDWRIALDGRR